MKLGSILLPSFFIIFIEADFPLVSVFVAVTPTCIVCRNWKSDFTMLEPRQLALSVETEDPTFTMFGAPPTYIVCRNWESNFTVSGPANLHCL